VACATPHSVPAFDSHPAHAIGIVQCVVVGYSSNCLDLSTWIAGK
jgi:hypothetical protein